MQFSSWNQDCIISYMDTTDPDTEFERIKAGAEALCSAEFPEKITEALTCESVKAWKGNIETIIGRFNLTCFLPTLEIATLRLYQQCGEKQDLTEKLMAVADFSFHVRSVCDTRKYNLTELKKHLDNTTFIKGDFKIKFGVGENKIYIKEHQIFYDREKNKGRGSTYWNALLTSLIMSDECKITISNFESIANTTAGDAMSKCANRLNKVLEQNFLIYHDKDSSIPQYHLRHETIGEIGYYCLGPK